MTHDMNGEVMDESIETPQQSNDHLPRSVQLPQDEGLGKENQKYTLHSEKERTAGETSDNAFEVGKESVQAEGKCVSPDPSIEKGKLHPHGEVCDGPVKSREVHLLVQALEGLLQEGAPGAPASATNDLKNGGDKDNTAKKSPDLESELENSNTFPDKTCNNSKDSSMLSTTDTQDEIETVDNGDQIFVNHVNSDVEKSANAKKEMLEMGMESEDSLDDMLGSDADPQTEETFSIVSGSEFDEASQGSVHDKTDKNNDVIILDNDGTAGQNGNAKSPEVHEINSDNEDDDCVITAENKTSSKKGKTQGKTHSELRRSNRTVRRKKYSYDYDNIDDESDVEEVAVEDPLKRKSGPIMINDTKSLVEIAAKQASKTTPAQKKEPQLVLIGSNPLTKVTSGPGKNNNSTLNASLYQSIVARGTTVTPVPNKTNTATQASQTPPAPAILPSLTDDMFVVEAPSFIVPYVYEKPSIEPFKEFVTKLGKELEEQKIKAEKELQEKKKEEKEKRQKEKQERRDRGEEVENSDEEAKRDAEENKKRKMEKKERRRRQKEEDDESWDGSDSTDSEDFKITDEDGTTVLFNDKDDSIEEAKNDPLMVTASTSAGSKPENYFDCSLGKFFMNIGMNLVQEYVQSDLLKQQKRKLQREKKSGQSTKERELSISLLMKNLELSKENNEPYACPLLKCEHCTFKTESSLVLAQHLETPHMKNNLYKCNFCAFEIRSPHDILFHMEAEHNVRGKLERAPSYHQCANCPFEDNGKGKLARHLVACAKRFKPEQNLSPPLEWEPPAKIPKVAKPRNTAGMTTPYANNFGRQQFGSGFGRPPINVTGTLPGIGIAPYRPRGARFPLPPSPRPVQAGGSIVRGSSMLRQNVASVTNYSIGNQKSKSQPSISITPLPRQPAPPAHVQAGQNSKGTFVICEICDGYIKDLDQLRNHMQWIHKVKIHPKMIYNRPPLNCQKCQFRFFTDQGLERHLLGSHGLVTSSMQEAANKSKDAGRCPVCGKVYQWKLLNHVARDHNLTLKPAHLSYKCTVCTATFGMYKLFENHVYSAHSVVAKRVMDKNAPAKTKSNAPKGLKINDEITITAQPAKVPAATANKEK